jgi:thymidylate synthase
MPRRVLRPAQSLFDYTYEHVELVGYDPHPAIKAPVAV